MLSSSYKKKCSNFHKKLTQPLQLSVLYTHNMYIQTYTYRLIHTDLYIQTYTYKLIHTDLYIQTYTYRLIHTDLYIQTYTYRLIHTDLT